MFRTAICLLFTQLLWAQDPASVVDTPPRVLRKLTPQYSLEARANNIQGTVIVELEVSAQGKPQDVKVISPLGFGLDEAAVAAVQKWEFAPGMRAGRAVMVAATVQVNFVFPREWFDKQAETRRTAFNIALAALQNPGSSPKKIEGAVSSMLKLSSEDFPPAMNVTGRWELAGEHVPKNPAHGLATIQKAAAKDYGPALYDLALRQMEGRDVPQDGVKGLATMQRAASMGSRGAQTYLGILYQDGAGVPPEPDHARQYFRLCAAQGASECQYRLGLLLLERPGRLEREFVQAVAWLQLAGAQGSAAANDLLAREAANVTPAQTRRVASLKTQLVSR